MSETLETLAGRLDRLEEVTQQISNQLSYLTDELLSKKPLKSEKPKTGVELLREMAIDKRPLSEGLRAILARTGIPEEKNLTTEELQERMARHSGIRPEDNEFSRAIIEERER